jgi:hypothetical protein
MNDKDLPSHQDVRRLTAEIAKLRRVIIFGFIALAVIMLLCFGHSDIVLVVGAIVGILWVAAHLGALMGWAIGDCIRAFRRK